MATATAPLKTLSARVSPQLHEETNRLAKTQGKSVNQYLEALLRKEVQEQKRRELFEAFTLLGEDAAGSDVEYAAPAQAEVLARD